MMKGALQNPQTQVRAQGRLVSFYNLNRFLNFPIPERPPQCLCKVAQSSLQARSLKLHSDLVQLGLQLFYRAG
jgi:hypothetical protein